jgi:hypothetical protein
MITETTIEEARKIADAACLKCSEYADYINSGRILDEFDKLNLPSSLELIFFENAEKRLEALEDEADEACRDVARIKRRNKKLRRKKC